MAYTAPVISQRPIDDDTEMTQDDQRIFVAPDVTKSLNVVIPDARESYRRARRFLLINPSDFEAIWHGDFLKNEKGIEILESVRVPPKMFRECISAPVGGKVMPDASDPEALKIAIDESEFAFMAGPALDIDAREDFQNAIRALAKQIAEIQVKEGPQGAPGRAPTPEEIAAAAAAYLKANPPQSGQRGSLFLGAFNTFNDLPPKDGVNVRSNDFAYVKSDFSLYRVT